MTVQTVEWAIVAPARTQDANAAAGVIPGWPCEVVQLLRNGHSSTQLALPTPRSNDAELVTTFGDRIIDPRGKARIVVLDGLLSADQYSRLTQFREDARAVYLSPNFDHRTAISVPLLATTKSIAGPDLTYATAGERFAWDSARQVLDTIGVDGEPIAWGGPFGRYGRPSAIATQNRAAKPHPDSVSTGWAITAGSGTVVYDDGVLSPVLARRHTANARGVTLLEAITTATIPQFDHAGASLTTSTSLCTSFYVMAEEDGWFAQFLRSDGVVLGSTSTFPVRPGTWQRFELNGQQAIGGTTATLRFLATGAGAGGTGSVLRVGPVFIGNMSVGYAIPDWYDTGAKPACSLSASVGQQLSSRSFTLSFLFRIPSQFALGTGVGLARLGTGGAFCQYARASDELRFDPTGATPTICHPIVDLAGIAPIAPGDWVHVVCTASEKTWAIWVNGRKLTNVSTADYDGGLLDTFKEIGFGTIANHYSCDSSTGICLWRVDNYPWSDEEIVRHYNTFGRPIGQAMVRQVYGRMFTIKEINAEQFSVDADDTLWRCEVALEQVSEGRDFAPVRRTEPWS